MGCFNVACGVSRISIGPGTPVVLIPLQITKHSDSITLGSCYVSNDGPTGRYYPLTLPIFGKYNNYGGIEDIVKDANTAAIEKYYNCSIDEFAEQMCRCDEASHKSLPEKALSMFVHRKIYDHLANNPVNEYGKKETAYLDSAVTPFILEYLGFVEGLTHPISSERYKRSFRHPNIPDVVIWSDGRWIEIGNDEGPFKNKETYIYHPIHLERYLVKKMFVPSTFKSLRKLRTTDILYDEQLEIMRLSQNKFVDHVFNGKTLEEKVVMKNLFRQVIEDCLDNIFYFKFSNWSVSGKYLREMYKDCYSLPDFKKQWADYKTFEKMLWHVNAPLMPSWNGLQCGNDTATLALANLTSKICKKSIAMKKQNDADE